MYQHFFHNDKVINLLLIFDFQVKFTGHAKVNIPS